jgi:hypothetical protein
MTKKAAPVKKAAPAKTAAPKKAAPVVITKRINPDQWPDGTFKRLPKDADPKHYKRTTYAGILPAYKKIVK